MEKIISSSSSIPSVLTSSDQSQAGNRFRAGNNFFIFFAFLSAAHACFTASFLIFSVFLSFSSFYFALSSASFMSWLKVTCEFIPRKIQWHIHTGWCHLVTE